MLRITYILIFCSMPMTVNSASLVSFLPDSLNGWAVSDSDRYYGRETLYNYIDGAAELYLSYGFDTVISRRYSLAGEPDLVVEIFDMLEPRNAFGAFTNMREKNQHRYGQGSQQIQGSLIFWKDRYFISIAAERTKPASLRTIDALAAKIDAAIPGEGEIPSIMAQLPRQNLVDEGFVYFHHYIWLNAFYFISNDNILNIGENTDAVLAKYGPPEKRMYLLMVKYSGENEAELAYKKFTSVYAPGHKGSGAIQMEDKTWFTTRLRGSMLAAVFNAPGREEALSLLNSWHSGL